MTDIGTWLVHLVDEYPSTTRYIIAVMLLLGVMRVFEQLGVHW